MHRLQNLTELWSHSVSVTPESHLGKQGVPKPPQGSVVEDESKGVFFSLSLGLLL